MDTSKEYIKMCEKTSKIQELWKREPGDFVVFHEEIIIFNRVTSIPEYTISYTNNLGETRIYTQKEWDSIKHIWLPRQEQLQAMLKESHTLGAILQGIYWFYEPEHFCPNSDDEIMTCKCASIGTERRKTFNTIEQFTLAFVMDELYKKRWNGEHWEDAHDSIASV